MKLSLFFIFLTLLFSPVMAEEDNSSGTGGSDFESMNWIDLIDKILLKNVDTQSDPDLWIFSINEKYLPSENFENSYQTFTGQLTEEQMDSIVDINAFKKQYFDSYLEQYVILFQAMEEGIFDSPEIQQLLKAALLQSIYKVYLQYKLSDDPEKFNPSSDEMNEYYIQNRERFDQSGLNTEQIRQIIVQDVSQQKMQVWVMDIIQQAKENQLIKRNQDVMKKLGLD